MFGKSKSKDEGKSNASVGDDDGTKNSSWWATFNKKQQEEKTPDDAKGKQDKKQDENDKQDDSKKTGGLTSLFSFKKGAKEEGDGSKTDNEVVVPVKDVKAQAKQKKEEEEEEQKKKDEDAQSVKKLEEDEGESVCLAILKTILWILGFGGIAMGIMLGFGMLYDGLVWGTVFKFYTFMLPVYTLISVALFAGRMIVRLTQKNRHSMSRRKLVYGLFVHVLFFIVGHIYVSVFINSGQSTNHEFFMNQQVYKQLTGGSFRTETGAWELKSLEDIDEVEDIWLWLKEPIVTNVFCNDEEIDNGMCTISDKKIGVTDMKLRTIRMQRTECKSLKNASKDSCVADYSDVDEKEEKSMWQIPASTKCPGDFLVQEGGGAWQDGSFVSFNGETYHSVHSPGEGGSYHRGGYVFHIYPSRLTSKNQIRTCLQHLQDSNFLDRQTRAMFFELYFQGFDLGVWHAIQIQIEFLASGALSVRTFQQHGKLPVANASELFIGFPSGPLARCTHPNGTTIPIQDCPNAQPAITDDLEIALLFYVTFAGYYILDLIVYLRDDGVRRFFSRGWRVFDFAIVAFLFGGLTLEILAQRSTPYYDGTSWYNYIHYQRQQQVMLSFLILLLWIKVLRYLSLYKSASILARTLARALRDIVMFGLLFAFVLFGFTLQFHILFGRASGEFYTVPRSLYSMVRGLTGDMDAMTLYRYEPTIAFIAYTFFILVVVFTLLTMLIAIINEHFVAVAMDLQQNNHAAPGHHQHAANEGDIEKRIEEVEKWLESVPPGEVYCYLACGENFKKIDPRKPGSGVDGYCKICVMNGDLNNKFGPFSTFCSRTIMGNSAPAWEECARFKVKESDILMITMYDRSANDIDTYLGEGLIHVNDIAPTGEVEKLQMELEDRRNVGKKIFSSYRVEGRVTIWVSRMPEESKKGDKK